MRKFLDGFYWGLGFAVAVLSVFVTYVVVGHGEVERSYQESMDKWRSENIRSFVDVLELELIEAKRVGNEILITTKMNNLGFTANSLGLSLRFSLYTTSGAFMGQCTDAIPGVDSKEEKIDMLSVCTTKFYPAEDFEKATLAVVR
ncbi:hypothetical protein [Shewanella sp. cp20]|uniref:hypothetical protein n=1 Tax=Shewanella sp. cp20 TaxID=1521167 RepID=UPI0005A0A649|nr:hypothetical protein [Shewanella sp. cp20]KIO37169.1 hypothetical protein DB48_05015 [Shewanella sp. cp20]